MKVTQTTVELQQRRAYIQKKLFYTCYILLNFNIKKQV